MIGKKIYYELSTGNVVLTVPERHNENAVNTTKEQDFLMYDVLQARNPLLIGVKQMAYKELQGDFNIANSVSINIENGDILFEFPKMEVPYATSIQSIKSENIDLREKNVELTNKSETLKTDVATMNQTILGLMMAGLPPM